MSKESACSLQRLPLKKRLHGPWGATERNTARRSSSTWHNPCRLNRQGLFMFRRCWQTPILRPFQIHTNSKRWRLPQLGRCGGLIDQHVAAAGLPDSRISPKVIFCGVGLCGDRSSTITPFKKKSRPKAAPVAGSSLASLIRPQRERNLDPCASGDSPR